MCPSGDAAEITHPIRVRSLGGSRIGRRLHTPNSPPHHPETTSHKSHPCRFLLTHTRSNVRPGNLGSTDFRLHLILNTIWGVYENSYYAHQRRILGDSEWSRFENQICVSYDRDAPRWTPAPGRPPLISIRPFLTEEFAGYTESLCDG